ncbi:MAG: mechanosensitive ion channel [Bacteroidaceae bacterium]|nr:mechanosensitive ion channel [Bacteroidaceae bacterium]
MNDKLFDNLGIGNGHEEVLKWAIIIVSAFLLFYVCDLIGHKIVVPIVHRFTKKTKRKWDDIILNDNTVKGLCRLFPGIIASLLLPVVLTGESTILIFCMKVCRAYVAIIGVSLLCNVFTSLYQISHESEKTKDHTLQGVFQMLKIIAIGIGAIVVVSIFFDKDPSKLLAGLGASAAILMLVFKDSILGLVAGIQLSANDMLRPGDWITMPKYGADGFVIDVTLTTVKIQNWDKTITTIPPYALVSDSFQNWRGMFSSGGRRIKRSIFIDTNSITFCDEKRMKALEKKGITIPEEKSNQVNLTLFREWLEEWLRNHSAINKEMIILVRQLQPTPQGLPLELYCFSSDTAWISYEHLQAEIFEYLFAVLPEFGLKAFQSPAGTDFNKERTN